ncbi:MAG: Rieske (2Fe-2S) protein [Candidatus Eremiobacteraeota bacterium]|nr:Rieske (2Fe-2S) protein [Candidatus Eremiobacteraeota bacterium]
MTGRERFIAAALVLAATGSLAFIVTFFVTAGRLAEGLTLAITAAAFACAALGWAFWIIPAREVIDERDDYPSTDDARAQETSEVRSSEREITRNRVLSRFLYAALGLFGLAVIAPIRSLGPAPDGALFHTKWRRGSRLLRENNTFVHVNDLEPDSVVTVFPENALDDAQSQTVLVRVADTTAGTARGYVAYSKVCTHAGCPVALYRAATKQLMCPCHQSVFDVLADGAVVSGPADHALPRLPIEIDKDGFVLASGDFPEPVGPGFWERGPS